jgi:hypothetical protein
LIRDIFALSMYHLLEVFHVLFWWWSHLNEPDLLVGASLSSSLSHLCMYPATAFATVSQSNYHTTFVISH